MKGHEKVAEYLGQRDLLYGEKVKLQAGQVDEVLESQVQSARRRVLLFAVFTAAFTFNAVVIHLSESRDGYVWIDAFARAALPLLVVVYAAAVAWHYADLRRLRAIGRELR